MVFTRRPRGDGGSVLVAELPAVLVVTLAFTLFFASVPVAFATAQRHEEQRAMTSAASAMMGILLASPALMDDPHGATGVFSAARLEQVGGEDGWSTLKGGLDRGRAARVQVIDVSEYGRLSTSTLLDVRSWNGPVEPPGTRTATAAPAAVVFSEREVHAARIVVTLWSVRS